MIPDTHPVCFVLWGFPDSTSVVRICTFGIQTHCITPDSLARGCPRKRRSAGGGGMPNKPDALYFEEISFSYLPIPGTARSKAKVCGRSPAEIVGSNPTGCMDVCLL